MIWELALIYINWTKVEQAINYNQQFSGSFRLIEHVFSLMDNWCPTHLLLCILWALSTTRSSQMLIKTELKEIIEPTGLYFVDVALIFRASPPHVIAVSL